VQALSSAGLTAEVNVISKYFLAPWLTIYFTFLINNYSNTWITIITQTIIEHWNRGYSTPLGNDFSRAHLIYISIINANNDV
jgi:hypothetical protein